MRSPPKHRVPALGSLPYDIAYLGLTQDRGVKMGHGALVSPERTLKIDTITEP